MIYLDYSATTPVLPEILDSYTKATKEYIGNSNSLHGLGIKSKNLLNSATEQLSNIFGVSKNEIIYTSGATESNNMALIGVCNAYKKRGKHIIVSKLEHPSIYGICDYLENIGFEITKVKLDKDGMVDLDDLKKQVREDTILVSICAVNSELGIRQPLKTIKQIIKRKNPNTFLHSDMTQAFGKTITNLHDVDLASGSGHKIFCPKGIGFLYKSEKVNMEPIIHGHGKDLRPGTVPLPLVVAFSKAMRIAVMELDKKEEFVTKLNKKLASGLELFERVRINQLKYSVPQILNVSIKGVKPETFIHALEKHDIYVGTNTACSSGEISEAVMEVYNDEKRAATTIRISISHLNTSNEISRFLDAFELVYNEMSTD